MKHFTTKFLALSFASLTVSLHAQATFENRLGGDGTDSGRSIEIASDGYITVGHTTTNSWGFADMYVVKTDFSGNLQWDKKIGGSGLELGYTIEKTSDGNFILAGLSTSYGNGSEDAYLVKIDGNGNILWEKTYPTTNSDRFEAAYEVNGNGFIAVGYTTINTGNGNDIFLVRTDIAGNEIWRKTFGGSGYETGNVVQPTSDGGFIIIGQTYSTGAGSGDFYLLKTDGSGNFQWDKTFGGTAVEEGKDVIETSDGGFVILGDRESGSQGDADIWIIKTDANGNLQWDRMFGGTAKEAGKSVIATTDGGYLIVGHTRSFGLPNPDVWVIKTDGIGTKTWDHFYGEPGHEHGYAAKQTSDGGYVVVGHSDIGPPQIEQVYIIKTNGQGTVTWVSNPVASDLNLWPNPSSGKINIELPQNTEAKKLIVLDLTGRVITRRELENNNLVSIDLTGIKKGVYIIEIETPEEKITSRILMQ